MCPEIIISKRKDGPMSVPENRKAFLKKHNLNPEMLVLPGQSHGKNIVAVNEKHAGKIVENTDGFITLSEGIILGVTVADCFPVFFFSHRLQGILHAGWKGIEGGIIEQAIDRAKELEEEEKNLNFHIGPGIDVCHFEVKEDVWQKFREFDSFLEKRDSKTFLSLKKIIIKKLKKVGVKNIKASSVCTYCNKEYFSFRRDKEINGMLALIYA